MTYNQPTLAQLAVITILESSPGGITTKDIRKALGGYAVNNFSAFMNGIATWSVFWEETDPDDGEIWFHSVKFNHLYNDRDFEKITTKPAKKQKSYIVKSRCTQEYQGDYAWVKIDRETCNKIKMASMAKNLPMITWFTQTINEKLSKSGEITIPEILCKSTTLTSVRLPSKLVERVKITIIGTKYTIGQFCTAAAIEKIGRE